jgi:hypothetical protein
MNPERPIQPAPRASRTGSVIIITAVVLVYSLASFFPALRPVAAFLALLVFFFALARREAVALPPTLLVFLVLAAPFLHPLLGRWPWGLLVPAVLLAALSLLFRSLSWGPWLKPGGIDGKTAAAIAATMAVSAAALFIWERAAGPDLSLHLSSLPELSAWTLPLAALGFSAGNAALEELIFRGVIMEATDSAFSPGAASLLAQAWVVGAAHFQRGFPNGWPGLALATVYGIMLGLLRRRSRGLAAPWIAHAGADLAIFTILVIRAAAKGQELP